MKQRGVAEARQLPIIKHRHRRQNDAAEGVVLDLAGRGIADAHRAVAVITLEVIGDLLIHRIGMNDAVNRANVVVRRKAENEGDELLHLLRGAEAIERLNDEIGVAKPAIAVIPGPARPWRLRYRGGEGGNDAAGLLEKLLSLRAIAARIMTSRQS